MPVVSQHIPDPDLWEQAGFEGLSLLLGEGKHIPSIVFVFREEKAAFAIFDDWCKRFGETPPEGLLEVAFVKMPERKGVVRYELSIAPPNYVSLKPPSDLVFPGCSSAHFKLWQRRVQETKQYALIPAILRGPSHIDFHPGRFLRLSRPKFRNARSIPDDHRLAPSRDRLLRDAPA